MKFSQFLNESKEQETYSGYKYNISGDDSKHTVTINISKLIRYYDVIDDAFRLIMQIDNIEKFDDHSCYGGDIVIENSGSIKETVSTIKKILKQIPLPKLTDLGVSYGSGGGVSIRLPNIQAASGMSENKDSTVLANYIKKTIKDKFGIDFAVKSTIAVDDKNGQCVLEVKGKSEYSYIYLALASYKNTEFDFEAHGGKKRESTENIKGLGKTTLANPNANEKERQNKKRDMYPSRRY